MADSTQSKEMIYSIRLDIESANKNLADYTQKVAAAKEATAQMVGVNNEQSEQMKRDEVIRKRTKDAIDAEEGSIRALRESNKQLTAERNNTSLSTEAGRKKVEELNKQLDENNAKIKENVDAYTKQKIGIGDYSGALDKLVPGLGATATGFLNMAKSAYAFIATGIGAIVVGVGLAIAAIIKYFQGSEEAQNRWNKVVAVGGALLEKFWDFVEGVGEALVDIGTKPLESLKNLGDFLLNNLINRFKAFGVIIEGIIDLDFKKIANGFLQLGTGVEDVIGKTQALASEMAATFDLAVTQGSRLAALQAKIDEDERKALVETARTRLAVAKLREEAITQEGEQRKETIEKAIALEKALADAEVARMQTKVEQARLQLQTNGDDKDAKLALAQAEAALINAEASRYEATLRFQKELERIQDEGAKKKQEQAEADFKFWQDTDERMWQATLASLERDQKARDKAREEQKKKDADAAEKRKQIEKEGETFATQSINKITGIKLDSGKLINNFFKTGALKQTLINAELMATGAYSALVGIPIIGPIIAPLAAMAARLYGLASAAGIQGITFGRGGIAKGRLHRDGGIQGMVGNQPIEFEDGEAIINRRSTQMFRRELSMINQAGGGVKFASGGIATDTSALSSSNETRLAMSSLAATEMARAMLEVLSRPSPPVLVLQDFEAVQLERNQAASRAKVI